ncbi:MAG: glycosyltransferase [Persicimonas sp.]
MSRPPGETPRTYRLMYIGRSSAQIERDFGERLSRLMREGFEVHVLAGDDGGFGALAERGVVVKPIPVDRRLNVVGLMGAYFIVQAYFIEQRPVLVHAFDDVLAWLGALAAERAYTEAIVVTVERHVLVDDPVRLELDTVLPVPPTLFERLEALLNNVAGDSIRNSFVRAYAYLGGLVDKYCVINEHDFQALQNLRIVEPDKLEMLIGGNGVDLEEFNLEDDAFPSVGEARSELGVPGNWRWVLGYHGPLTLARGASDLIECIERLAKTHPAAGWLVGLEPTPGKASSSKVMLGRLERLERTGRVKIVREPAEARLFYRALDLYVNPSYREGAPTHLMQAAAAGVSAVAYHLPATQTVIEHGQTGDLLPRGEVDALVEAIRRSLDEPRRLETYGVRARGRAVRKFSRQHVEDQVFRMYDTVLETRLHRPDAPHGSDNP